ncbi:PREDICTED: RING finger protein 214 [Nanorana parkeri]|uniref:RING finger protein 214 n=1 Tax=Nanorana parkeri TaxID=125878 RepID=UPI00085437EC|nr:PREDICTED: RING finger protein 214 [Nanorana parkeri]
MLEAQSSVEGDIGCQLDTENNQRRPLAPQNGEHHNERQTKCISVQTEYSKQDAETITDGETEKFLKQLISCREQLKNSYQKVLDRQTRLEKNLQVQIKQLKQKREEETHKHKENLKSIQDLTIKKEEARKKVEKEGRELSQKEQDLSSELVKLQSKSESLKQEQAEFENKIVELLAEQATEREEWDAELASLKKKEIEVTQGALKELERAQNAEVLSLESRRDLLLISLEEAEKDAEVTLSYLRVAPPHKEWLQLKHRWDSRLAGIQQMKANLQEQFEVQIKQVKGGAKLSSLHSILAPDLPPPPSDPNLMLQKIAFGAPPISNQGPAAQLSALIPPHGHAFQQPLLGPSPFLHQRPPLLAFTPGNLMGTIQSAPRSPGISDLHSPEVSGPPSIDKLSKILEKLQARFPQCNKAHLTDILQRVKMNRGTLSGLTVEELCHLVATQLLREPPNPSLKVTQPIGHGRPQYQNTQRASPFLSAAAAYVGRPQLCLICQHNVQLHDLQPMSCNHVMHIVCIRSWSMTNKTNSCPFCPNQR